MKTILLILALSIGLNSMANDPITTSIPNKVYKDFTVTERKTEGILMLTAGIVLIGLGVYRESIRQPYPTHATDINYKPNVERTINYMIIGAGIGFGLGGGIKLIRQ